MQPLFLFSICMFSLFPQMVLHYFPGFLLTLVAASLSHSLSGLSCCLPCPVSSCLCQGTARLPLFQLEGSQFTLFSYKWFPISFFTHFFLPSFCLNWLTLSLSFLPTFLPSFTLLFSLPLQPNFLAISHPLSSLHISVPIFPSFPYSSVSLLLFLLSQYYASSISVCNKKHLSDRKLFSWFMSSPYFKEQRYWSFSKEKDAKTF